MSRFVRGAVHSCCPYTPTLPHTRTNEGGGGMRVRHDPGTSAQERCAPRLYKCLSFHDNPCTNESSKNTVVRTSIL